MQITINIPDDKLTEFKIGFLAVYPIPAADPTNPEIVEFTEAQWLKEWIKHSLIRVYSEGKRRLATQAAEIDEEII